MSQRQDVCVWTSLLREYLEQRFTVGAHISNSDHNDLMQHIASCQTCRQAYIDGITEIREIE